MVMLLSNCCAQDFNPIGYEKEPGIWQERCNGCGKLCEPLYINDNDIENIHNCIKWNANPIEEKEEVRGHFNWDIKMKCKENDKQKEKCKACQHELICDDPLCVRKCPYHVKPKKIEPINSYILGLNSVSIKTVANKVNEIIDALNGRGE